MKNIKPFDIFAMTFNQLVPRSSIVDVWCKS